MDEKEFIKNKKNVEQIVESCCKSKSDHFILEHKRKQYCNLCPSNKYYTPCQYQETSKQYTIIINDKSHYFLAYLYKCDRPKPEVAK